MSYNISLKQFEGPLDLLLHLIEKTEVDIKDIFVSEITAQYLEFMEQTDELDMETASEFISMAATLLLIKSRSMLPKPIPDDDSEEDPEVVLIRQLREYKAFKEATTKFGEMLEDTEGRFVKLPEEFALPPREIIVVGGTTEGLFNAFCNVLARKNDEPSSARTHEVTLDEFTVRKQLKVIRAKLNMRGTLDFYELFDDGYTKLEVIVTFMALLDMIMRSEIKLTQSTPYGSISIAVRSLASDDEDAQYMDEEID